jgi:molybdopterin converting factor small subunit
MINMANTKKTASDNATGKKNTTTIKKLEAQLEEQRKQIEILMDALQNNVIINNNSNNNISDDISADEEILVMSLTPNKLNLVGDGGTVLFSFDEMYEEQFIDYASLKEIVRLNRDMARNGRFYILDERVVNKLRLKNNYKNVLNPEQLKKILSVDVNKAIELYKMANDVQKRTIIELVKQSKFKGDTIDYNLLGELSNLSGINLIEIEDATQIDVTE